MPENPMTVNAGRSAESRPSRTKAPAVIVVIPTYNEAENLPVLISALCDQKIKDLGIIVVDDDSPDGTGEIADRLVGEFPGYFEVIHRPRKLGLGPAYVAGFQVALQTGAFAVIEMDADMSHPVADVPTLIAALKNHDVIVGSRYIPGGSVDPSWSFPRRALSWLGNRGIRLLVGVKVKDATSGFKAFRSSTLRSSRFPSSATHATRTRRSRKVRHRKAGRTNPPSGAKRIPTRGGPRSTVRATTVTRTMSMWTAGTSWCGFMR